MEVVKYNPTAPLVDLGAQRMKCSTEERSFNADQPRDPDGKFASDSDLSSDKTQAAFQKLGGEKALGKALSSWQMPSGSGKTIGEKTADAVRAGKTTIIIAAIRNEHTDGELHRGVNVPPDSQLMSWKAGMSVQIMPSSFSSSSKIAESFSKMPTTKDDFYGASKFDWKSVVLHVDKYNQDDEPTNGIVIGTRGNEGMSSEKETISGGRFNIINK